MQRGNPHNVRAHVTDHAVRRYAERALQETVDATVEDDDAIVELRRRKVPIGAIRRRLAIAGGLGVANGACAVVTEGLKLVIADRSVVTVLAKKWRQDAAPAGPSSPVPPRPRIILKVGAGA